MTHLIPAGAGLLCKSTCVPIMWHNTERRCSCRNSPDRPALLVQVTAKGFRSHLILPIVQDQHCTLSSLALGPHYNFDLLIRAIAPFQTLCQYCMWHLGGQRGSQTQKQYYFFHKTNKKNPQNVRAVVVKIDVNPQE